MSVLRRWERRNCKRLVLLAEPNGWALTRVRMSDRLLVGLRSRTLDLQLAAGHPVLRNRLRSVRAALLIAPSTRGWLATSWENLLTRGPRNQHAPVQWREVAAAAQDIEHLVAALRAPQPVSPRGVAIANLLLTDGTGPLYQPDAGDLRALVRTAVHCLDPFSALCEL